MFGNVYANESNYLASSHLISLHIDISRIVLVFNIDIN